MNLTPTPLRVGAIVYTQVKLPPLIPPMLWGETGKISSLPFARGGLGRGQNI